jgi:hypothetical protein
MTTINHKQETERRIIKKYPILSDTTIYRKQETDGRIIKKYPSLSDHCEIIANRFDLLFNRRADPSTFKRDGLVCGFLSSVENSHLKEHLKTVIQEGLPGVEAIFDSVLTNKSGAPITRDSKTRFMARLGTLGTSNKPMEGCIPMKAKLVALYRTDIFTKKDFYF